jgi:hypothetical protein
VDSFGRTSLAWASLGLQAHRLDTMGPHAESQRQSFGYLEDDAEDLAQSSHAKRFAQEGKIISLLSLMSSLGGLGHGGEVTCSGTWTF